MNRIDVRNPSRALDATGRKVIRLEELVVDRNRRGDSSFARKASSRSEKIRASALNEKFQVT